ncbi:hypothetical protein KCP76_14385 [Salmonella enterica subsp. enterica serovar Weltevreden]|nr:hypothetical protein KCP76_14385 [Salmonella enterica subsp. enterica serovar Weltevreden]
MGRSLGMSCCVKNTSGKLIQLMNETVDGDCHEPSNPKDGAYVREHFFGKYRKQRWWPTGPMSRFGR